MTSSHISQGSRKPKHHSFLNVLDNIATSSPDFTFAPALAPVPFQQPRQDDAVKQLSESFRAFTSNEYEHKQLPELPVPSYDNGNIDALPQIHSKAGRKPRLTQATSKTKRSSPRVTKRCTPSPSHLPKASFGQAFSASTFADMPQLQGPDEDSSLKQSNPANSTARNRNSRASARKSRPASSYSTSTASKVVVRTRPGSSESASRSSRPRKRSITFDEQRACPQRVHESPKPRPSADSHTPRRGFRLIPNFKDLRTKPEKKRRVEETVPLPRAEDDQTMPMMSLKEALRGVAPLSPLHDPKQDQEFAQECSKLLSLRREASKYSFMDPEPAKQLPDTPQEASRLSLETLARPSMHAHRISETMSISTSILDWSWPQPDTYKALESNTTQKLPPARRESTTIPCHGDHHADLEASPPFASLAESPHLDFFPKLWTAPIFEKRVNRSPPPSAPPKCPLPRLPLTEAKGNSCQPMTTSRIHHYPLAGSSPQSGSQSSAQIQKPGPASSRLSRLAASKGLALDSSVALHTDTLLCDMEVHQPSMPLSPLRLRFNKSNRNSKVNELKKRHLSMLVRDGVNIHADGPEGTDAVDFARRGSAPDAMQTSTANTLHTRRPASRMRRASIDKYKPLPLTPGSKASSRKSSTSSTSLRQRKPSYVWSPLETHPQAKRSRRQSLNSSATTSKALQTLAQSNVMTLVDSDPRAAHGFRAGETSPASSIKKKHRASRSYKPARFDHSDDSSSDRSRPSSSSQQSIMTDPRSDGTAITVPSSARSASFAAEVPLNASFDSGYGSSYDDRHSDSDGHECSPSSIRPGTASSHQLDAYKQTTSASHNAQSNESDNEQRVERLRDEADRIRRVYNAMLRARQDGLAQEYMDNKRYAELLDDDRETGLPLPEIRTSKVLAKIEADLASTPPKADSDSERTITPSPTQNLTTISAFSTSDETDVDGSVVSSPAIIAADMPAPLRLSRSSLTVVRSSSTTSTTIESSAQLPIRAGSTLLSANRYSPQAAISRSTPSPPLKRSSILSQYNPYPPAQPSPTTTRKVSPTSIHAPPTTTFPSPPRNILGRLPQKQVAIGPNMPTDDIDQDIAFDFDIDNGVPPFLTNTRQMDRAIEEFQASTSRNDNDSKGIVDAGSEALQSHHRNGGVVDLRRIATEVRDREYLGRTSSGTSQMEETASEYEGRTGRRPPM
ncbi:hypothetical protein PMZ80_005826 [Knufia obscura]|uniref:Uncharacterized protein n=2 Tax=Knufia TaxID=430999 RepID=A0AAN8F0D8_9EURO|nr:hypothetical protein PMZ80_005826 [Knufia obscura]KAK5954493.1 hypothetical protein OHC33_004215 [Knufia fluminis]